MEIIDSITLSFNNKEEDFKKGVDDFLQKVGYPNLYLDTSDAYEGYLNIVNVRNAEHVLSFSKYGSKLILFEEKGYLKLGIVPEGKKGITEKDVQIVYYEPVMQVCKREEDAIALGFLTGLLSREEIEKEKENSPAYKMAKEYLERETFKLFKSQQKPFREGTK